MSRRWLPRWWLTGLLWRCGCLFLIVPLHLTWWLELRCSAGIDHADTSYEPEGATSVLALITAKDSEVRRMDRAIRRMWMSAACVFVLLMGTPSYIKFFDSKTLMNNQLEFSERSTTITVRHVVRL